MNIYEELLSLIAVTHESGQDMFVYVSSEASSEPAQKCSLSRSAAAHTHKLVTNTKI